MLKFVPVIVTTVPANPLAGEKEVMVGAGPQSTMKSTLLVAPSHPTKTLIGPLNAFAGTVVVILVVVLAVTTAGSPLKSTRLSAGLVLKSVPVMVTVAPITSVVGVNEVIVGVGGQLTSKSVELVTLLQEIVIVMGTKPLGPVGTVVVILVLVLALTAALYPPKSTMLLEGIALKFVPVIMIVVPTTPDPGEKDVMVGTGPQVTVKLPLLMTLPPMVITLIGPVNAPEGTVQVIEVDVLAVTTAVII